MTVFLSFQLMLDVVLFPVLSATDITEAYEVGDSCYAYTFFAVVTL